MRASNARQVTATTCPLVDIQLSFCSRSASAYFGGNLPQKVKLVNGLAPRSAQPRYLPRCEDTPGRMRHLGVLFSALGWPSVGRLDLRIGQLYHCSSDDLMSRP